MFNKVLNMALLVCCILLAVMCLTKNDIERGAIYMLIGNVYGQLAFRGDK